MRPWTEPEKALLRPLLAVTARAAVLTEISAELGRTVNAVRLMLHYMRKEAHVTVQAGRPAIHGRYAGRARPSQAAQRQSPANPPPPQLARRQCLRCRAGFDPQHRGNFLCSACNRANSVVVAL